MILPAIRYWMWIATIALITLTYKDIKNKGYVDDRKNWFMMGISFSLITHFNRNILYLGVIIALTIGIQWFFKKYITEFGEADLNSLTWLFYGLGIINPFYLFWFIIYFSFISILYFGIKKMLKITEPTPFYMSILCSFVVLGIMFRMYI